MRILLVGGGTLGSVSPLLAIAEQLKQKDSHIELLWVGTKAGPEKDLMMRYGIPFAHIRAGKLRRYFSARNIADILNIALGCIASLVVLYRFNPAIVIGAGSFVQVPVIFATHFFKRKTKILIHQQDIQKGLANTLCSPFANTITVGTEKSLQDFPPSKTIFTGNPYRKDIREGITSIAFKIFKLEQDIPVVLVVGGGTGSAALNRLVLQSLLPLTAFCQIIHITGKNKMHGGQLS